VRFSGGNGCYELCAEDDGHEFRWSGRSSSAERGASSHGAVVIKECVRAISNKLVIGSIPGSGAPLAILVFSAAHGRVYSDN
jgi:hypothetical protein